VVNEELITNTHVSKQAPVSQYHVAGHATERASTTPNDDADDEISELLYMITLYTTA
jgi:hypothetical protein